MTDCDHPQECVCRSTDSRVALVFSTAKEFHTKLADAAETFGWSLDAQLSVVDIPVGTQESVPSLKDLADLLLGLLGQGVETLRFAFLDSGRISGQTARLLAAVPFREFFPAEASPIRKILETEGISTWFQPVVAADGETIWGYECLARAELEDGTVVSPSDLLRWAREENLLFFLDRVCRERHIANAARSLPSPDVKILINFLPTVIYDPSVCLLTTVTAAVEAGLDPRRVCFEVVESEEIKDFEHLNGILAYYRKLGFLVALDDVGAGYSGLTLLAEVESNLIKLDRKLVQKSSESELVLDLCRKLVEFSHDHGRLILAEGVETEVEFEAARELGVDLFQGYFFGKPAAVPATVITTSA